MNRGNALEISVLKGFIETVNGAFDALKTLTEVDLLDRTKAINDNFDGQYFVDWFSDYGIFLLTRIKNAPINEVRSDDFLDCLDYNDFVLSKAIATKDADIIYATLADSLFDVNRNID